jgi:hypothetical protein
MPRTVRLQAPIAQAACLAACLVAAAGPGQGEPSLSSLDLRVGEADLAPSITLKEADNRSVQEYRVNNSLYMVKITPRVGASYYLVDQDGSGDMTLSRYTPEIETQVPQWVLHSW